VVTVPLSSDDALRWTNVLYNRLRDRRPEIDKFDRYFKGEQGRLVYGTKEWAELHEKRFAGFSDNWCGIVGSAPGERTSVDGFRLGEDTDPLSADERGLWRDWELNEMPMQASQGFLQSTIAKRSYVLVWGNRDDEPLITWEHPAQVIVAYDPETRAARFALKAWIDDEHEFATLYTPDEVWKWQRQSIAGQVVNGQTESGLYVTGMQLGSAGGWEPRDAEGDDTWPISNPLGVVPIVEFPNRPLLGNEPLSDIAGAMAMQDAVNLLWAYLFVAADYASMPARVVMGQDPPKLPILDQNGQKVGEQPVDQEALKKGRMLWLTGQNAKIGQWDAARLDVFTQVINVAVKHTASQTRTPIHYIVGDLGNVNGETLTATETPLANKVREAHKFYTPAVRGVNQRIALVRGNTGLAEACRTGRVQWANPETRSDAQLADAALKDRSVGFPLQWVAEKRYGLKQDEIDRLMRMVEAERSDPVLEQALRDVGTTTDDAPGS
jgi:hypothetical protein